MRKIHVRTALVLAAIGVGCSAVTEPEAGDQSEVPLGVTHLRLEPGASASVTMCADVPKLHLSDGTEIDPNVPPPANASGFYYTCTPCSGYPSWCATVDPATGDNVNRIIVNITDGSLDTPPYGSTRNGWAGKVFWNWGAADNRKFVVFHPGGDGSSADSYTFLADRVKAAGGVAVRIAWEDPGGTSGDETTGIDGDTYVGWSTRPSAAASNLFVLSKRPAAVFEWINSNIANYSDARYGIVGCSRGSDVAYMARLWHNADAYVDYMLLGGGPPSADVYKACSSTTQKGRCTLGVRTCNVDADCSVDGYGVCDAWNIRPDDPTPEQGATDNTFYHMRAKMNHVHARTSECGQTAAFSDFKKSSFIGNPLSAGDWDSDYQIDFTLNAATSYLSGDDTYDVLVSGEETYARAQPSSGKKTILFANGNHCQVMGTEPAWERLRDGMGFGTGISSGLKALYRFDGTDRDGSGMSNIVSTTAGTSYDAGGKVGQALRIGGAGNGYDGSSSKYARAADSASLNITGPFTVAGWFYAEGNVGAMNADTVLVDKLSSTGGFGAIFTQPAGKIQTKFCGTSGCRTRNSATTIAAGTWYHYAGTWDGTTLHTYLNGALDDGTAIGSVVSVGSSAGTPLTIGRSFDGLVDDLRVYNRALSDNEVKGLSMSWIAAGTAASDWKAYSSTAIYLDANTSVAGFAPPPAAPPVFVTSLGGRGSHWVTLGGTAPYVAESGGFRSYIEFNQSITPEMASNWAWRVNYIGMESGKVSTGIASGRTTPYATSWVDCGTSCIYVDVNTSSAGFGTTPRYFTSLGGVSSHYLARGATSIFSPTATGFRVYLDGAAYLAAGFDFSAAYANANGWHINWIAKSTSVATPGLASGSTPVGGTNWQTCSPGDCGSTPTLYLDVDTTAAGFSSTPIYVTSLGGNTSHDKTRGASAIYSATPTGFRVYVDTKSLPSMTPAQANSAGWHIHWLAKLP